MHKNIIYTKNDDIFKSLSSSEKWIKKIFKNSDLDIYLFNMVIRRTKSGKSTYTDIIGYNGSELDKLTFLNDTINYITINGSAINTHFVRGIDIQKIKLFLNKKDNLHHIDTPLNFEDLTIAEHTKFNYNIVKQNQPIVSQKPYVHECIYPIDENKQDKKYYVHFISLAKGRETTKEETNKNKIEEDSQEIISSQHYYGYGLFLMFISDKEEVPNDYFTYVISNKLNDYLLESLVEVHVEIEEKRKEVIDANRKIIKEMKDIAEHVNKARKISDKIQARLESFGDIFTEWFTQGLKDVFTSGKKIGNYNNKSLYGEHNPDKSSYQTYIKRLTVSLSEYFDNNDHEFIYKHMYNELNEEGNKGDINTITNIKTYYKTINEVFPIGLILFFFLNKESYNRDYEKCVIKLKDTPLSHKSIINGLNKLFFTHEIKDNKINIEIDNNQYLIIRLVLDREGDLDANKLLSTLIHQHNREPEPYHRATTYIIRSLMGIDSENYHNEKLADINIGFNARSYRTGIISHNKAIIEAKVEQNSFILKYLLYDESYEGI